MPISTELLVNLRKKFFFIYRANYSHPDSSYLLNLIITMGKGQKEYL